MSYNEESRWRAEECAKQYGLTLSDELGHGVHGIVFVTESQSQKAGMPFRSALKSFQREVDYLRERDVYLRLQKHKVKQVRGCNVPQLLRYDDNWMVIEITMVQRPFVLDFAGAYLDRPTEFSDEVMADWREQKLEQFGKRWPEVQAILCVLETYGVFMEDVHPNNVAFVDLKSGAES